jgi:hypothetical protein
MSILVRFEPDGKQSPLVKVSRQQYYHNKDIQKNRLNASVSIADVILYSIYQFQSHYFSSNSSVFAGSIKIVLNQ